MPQTDFDKEVYPVTKNRQTHRGFTLPEMLMVIAILGILFAVSAPALMSFSNNMNQTALDNTAREIFVAVQNKMTTMKASGMDLPQGRSMGANAPSDYTPVDAEPASQWPNQGSATDPDSPNDAYRYVESSDSDSMAFLLGTTYDQHEGYFVVEYNKKTGDVYGVFYSEKAGSLFGKESKFDGMTYKTLLQSSNGKLTDAEGEYDVRQSLEARQKWGVGYYGANNTAMPESSENQEFDFHIGIINDDKLQLKILPTKQVPEMKYHIFITSQTDLENGIKYELVTNSGSGNPVTASYYKPGSSAAISYSFAGLTESVPDITASGEQYGFMLTLDSVEGSKHFANLFPGIAPGDNIRIEVKAEYTGTEAGYHLADKIEIVERTNSLFAERTGSAVTIASGRHLQNLSCEASNLGWYKTAGDGAEIRTKQPVTKANLIADIDWQGTYHYQEKNTLYSGPAKLDSFQPISNYNTGDSGGNGSSFKSVMGLKEFAGGDHTISNLIITEHTPAIARNQVGSSSKQSDKTGIGLFGVVYDGMNLHNFTMKNCHITSNEEDTPAGVVAGNFYLRKASGQAAGDFASSVSNIHIVDCSVTANSAAGMIVGALEQKNDDSVEISNCQAYLDGDTATRASKYTAEKTGTPNYAVNSTENAGGLVGTLEAGRLTMQNSFAAVKVWAGTNGGGLIGESKAPLTVLDSYAAGDVDSASDSTSCGVGGLIGLRSGGMLDITNGFTTSNITADGAIAGGACGLLDGRDDVDIANVQSYGTVTRSQGIGKNNTDPSQCLTGGFLGRSSASSLRISNASYLSMPGYNDAAQYYDYPYVTATDYTTLTSGAAGNTGQTYPYSTALSGAFPFRMIPGLDYYGNWSLATSSESDNPGEASQQNEPQNSGSESSNGANAANTINTFGASQPEPVVEPLESFIDNSTPALQPIEAQFAPEQTNGSNE